MRSAIQGCHAHLLRSQSTSSCSLRETSLSVTMALMPSTAPVVEKAQQEPHCRQRDTDQLMDKLAAAGAALQAGRHRLLDGHVGQQQKLHCRQSDTD